MQGALSCGKSGASVKQALITKRLEGEQALCERFAQAQEKGDFSLDADPSAMARYLGTVLQGMAIQAVSGATTEQLMQIAELSLHVFKSLQLPLQKA